MFRDIWASRIVGFESKLKKLRATLTTINSKIAKLTN